MYRKMALSASGDLTRTRKQLIRERSREVTRVGKLLELANIKLGSVVTDIMGMTGRAILEAGRCAGCSAIWRSLRPCGTISGE